MGVSFCVPLPSTAEEPPEVLFLQHSNPVQAIIVAQNSHIYAGTFGGGVYRSIDEGKPGLTGMLN